MISILRNKFKLNKNLILFLTLFCLIVTTVNSQEKSDSEELDKTKVCMVDDQYKGEQQLITVIDNKKYYGCCEPCIEILNTDSSYRFAKDHFTGKSIDKAKAYIVRKTKNNDAVLYFENKINYQAYIAKHKK